MTVPAIGLSAGVTMPQLGLGTWSLTGDRGAAAIRLALRHGYRSLDTASLYANEDVVGQAVRESGVIREDLFITTKIWNTDQGYDGAMRAFDASMARLRLEHLDLYLIHWPAPARNTFVETWRALEKLHTNGRVRAIGVSNFRVGDLTRLMDETDIVPAVNQIELHPLFVQAELRNFHARHGIATQAWSPLAMGKALLDAPVLVEIAKRHRRTPAQIVLRWHLQSGIIAIPRSRTPARIVENFDVFDFELSKSDIDLIDSMDQGQRLGEHPAEMN